jgi:hypothetical protein
MSWATEVRFPVGVLIFVVAIRSGPTMGLKQRTVGKYVAFSEKTSVNINGNAVSLKQI